MTVLALMRILHFLGFTLWISGLVGMASALQTGARSRLAGILGDLGATLVIISGVYSAIERSLFVQPYMHIKLTLVAVLVGLHVAMRVKSRKQVAGSGQGLLVLGLVVTVAILAIIVIRPLAR